MTQIHSAQVLEVQTSQENTLNSLYVALVAAESRKIFLFLREKKNLNMKDTLCYLRKSIVKQTFTGFEREKKCSLLLSPTLYK